PITKLKEDALKSVFFGLKMCLFLDFSPKPLFQKLFSGQKPLSQKLFLYIRIKNQRVDNDGTTGYSKTYKCLSSKISLSFDGF
ncbi:MAG: hypothetical protein UE068_09645, partial [Paludibacteraceae bacterium]|nr:hypothetical protein [Paludibacteraceae bacterium]